MPQISQITQIGEASRGASFAKFAPSLVPNLRNLRNLRISLLSSPPVSAPILEKFRQSLEAGAFLKLTLSGYRGAEAGLRNLYARPVELREGHRLSFVWHYATRDVTKNFPPEEAATQFAQALESGFRHAHLFTLTGDWRWDAGGKLKASRPTFTQAPSPEHDRTKIRATPIAGAAYLHGLGLANAAGEPRPGAADKLRQIERFVELIGHLAEGIELPQGRPLRVLDLGAGKGYLTFALTDFLRHRAIPAEVTGIEQRPELVDLTNRVAREAGFAELRFVPGTIASFQPAEPPDWIVALHACNTATDDALFRGIQARSSLIVAAPCCHQELRPQIVPPSVLAPILRHGILLEREAESLTDGIRALLLEIAGYRASVFEFISPEHTGKNLMLTAQRRREPLDPAPLREQLRAVLAFYGLQRQHLAHLLGEPEAY